MPNFKEMYSELPRSQRVEQAIIYTETDGHMRRSLKGGISTFHCIEIADMISFWNRDYNILEVKSTREGG